MSSIQRIPLSSSCQLSDAIEVVEESLSQKIEEIARTRFKLEASNVKSLLEAEVICLGEIHYIDELRVTNAMLIDALYQEGDILLTEDSGRGTSEDDQGSFVKSPIARDGWDLEFGVCKDDKETSAHLEADKLVKEPSKFYLYYLKDNLEAALDRERAKKITRCGALKVLLSMCCCSIFSKVFSSCIRKYYSARLVVTSQTIYDHTLARNENMIKKIDAALMSHKRVFVIAGKGHFKAHENDGKFNYEKERLGVRKVLEYLSTKRFAIMNPIMQ